MSTRSRVVIGTRKSKLALAQTQMVAESIRRVRPDLAVELYPIVTQGDVKTDQPLPEIGGKGLFTLELEQALSNRQVDLAVHSAKDLPAQMPADLDLLCVPARVPPNDVLVCPAGAKLADLPAGARIGTSSLRRLIQLRAIRPDLQFLDIRGNIDTRIRKAREGQYDAVVLAQAGLIRAGLDGAITEIFPVDQLLPAPGQAALAVQGRRDDDWLRGVLVPINDAATAACLAAERQIVEQLCLDCRLPFAALCEPAVGDFRMRAWMADAPGQRVVRVDVQGSSAQAAAQAAVAEIDAAGGRAIIDTFRR